MVQEKKTQKPIRAGYRHVSITVPADLVVRIDVIAAQRADYPSRSDLITEAMAEYLAGRPDPQGLWTQADSESEHG